MRYVVIGDYRAIEEFRRDKRLMEREVIPVPVAGRLGQALMGLHPAEVGIVLVHGSHRYVDAEALAHIERFRALGAQFMVYE